MTWSVCTASHVFLRWPLEAPYEALEERDINIERAYYAGVPHYYVSYTKYHVGLFPGVDSDEWIEYIPEPES